MFPLGTFLQLFGHSSRSTGSSLANIAPGWCCPRSHNFQMPGTLKCFWACSGVHGYLGVFRMSRHLMLYAYFHRMKGNAGNLYGTELTLPKKVFIVRLPVWLVQQHKWMNDGAAEEKHGHLLFSYSWSSVDVTTLSLCHVCCHSSFASYVNLYKILSLTTKKKTQNKQVKPTK